MTSTSACPALRIAVGSTRPAKVESTRAAIEAIASVDGRFRHATLEAMDLTDVAPTMPMTDRAILDGARLRARTLMERLSRADPAQDVFAVGVEGGLDPLAGDPGRYVLRTWAAVTDGRRWGVGDGGAILVPESITHAVLAGRELGHVIDEVAGTAVRGTRGAWGVLSLDLIDRQASFRAAIVSAFAPFYNPRLYQA
jgi:inosine/xanthosine triphosphatase